MTAKRENRHRPALLLVLLSCLAGPLIAPAAIRAQTGDRRVFVVTLDGMRWQEIFAGADSTLLFGPAGGVADTAFVAGRFWRPGAQERRATLLPFLWRTLVPGGQILGDSAARSIARVTNGKRFSYPGYNEMFSGAADGRIDSNDKVANPNVTVVEWLNGKDAYRGRVAVFGSWDVFPWIFNTERSGIPVMTLGPPFPAATAPRRRAINQFTALLPRFWRSSALDAPAMEAALETLRSAKPRVLVVLLGETDEWAHDRRYDLYLDAAYRADRFIARLWETAESMPEYRGRTSLIVSTDHGRGAGDDWTDHGRDVPAADRIWVAMMGPRTAPLGVRHDTPTTQSQVAATIAALLGEDWQSARPEAAPPIFGAVGSGRIR